MLVQTAFTSSKSGHNARLPKPARLACTCAHEGHSSAWQGAKASVLAVAAAATLALSPLPACAVSGGGGAHHATECRYLPARHCRTSFVVVKHDAALKFKCLFAFIRLPGTLWLASKLKMLAVWCATSEHLRGRTCANCACTYGVGCKKSSVWCSSLLHVCFQVYQRHQRGNACKQQL